MKAPLVSIIITAYNRSEYTIEAIESVLSQTYSNIELIVVNNGSYDDTEKKLAPYKSKIKYLYKENRGACAGRNLGLQHATGKYISFLDNDDVYLPERIKLCVEYMEKYPQVGLLHSRVEYIDAQRGTLGVGGPLKTYMRGKVIKDLILSNFICNPTVMLRKAVLDKAGPFDETIFPPADWDLWLRVADHSEVDYINQPLAQYRVGSQGCLKDLEAMDKECEYVINKFFDRHPQLIKSLKNKALARHHFRMAQYHLVSGDETKMNYFFQLSRSLDPLSLKSWIFGMAVRLARPLLIQKIKKAALIF